MLTNKMVLILWSKKMGSIPTLIQLYKITISNLVKINSSIK